MSTARELNETNVPTIIANKMRTPSVESMSHTPELSDAMPRSVVVAGVAVVTAWFNTCISVNSLALPRTEAVTSGLSKVRYV